MAVALFEATDFGKTPMTRSKTLIALALLATTATAAQAGDWTNSGMYNGYGANMNQNSSYQLRDGNGNLTMVDGRPVSAQYSQGSGAQYAGGGVGTGGAMNAYGQATAIGNQLSVTVIGSRNTTIIDSTQINNGNQTATADLNTH
ncbi:MAG: holdfast anchoring protein HfaA [Pseudomonadota bacterium]